MKRRNFLKSLFGVVVIPSICTAKLPKHTKSKNVDIDFNNVNINGTFDEWVESIRAEVQRLLKPINQGDEKYIIKTKASYWGNGKSIPAKSIIVSDKYIDLGWFSLAKCEFKSTRHRKKHLTRLVQVRFIDMLWSMNSLIVYRYNVLKRFDPRYKVEDYA